MMLHIGNIRLESSFKDLQKHLEQYGGVESVYLKPQWNFAFVDLLPSTDIDDFISKANGSTYHKNVLTVARKKSPGSHIGSDVCFNCGSVDGHWAKNCPKSFDREYRDGRNYEDDYDDRYRRRDSDRRGGYYHRDEYYYGRGREYDDRDYEERRSYRTRMEVSPYYSSYSRSERSYYDDRRYGDDRWSYDRRSSTRDYRAENSRGSYTSSKASGQEPTLGVASSNSIQSSTRLAIGNTASTSSTTTNSSAPSSSSSLASSSHSVTVPAKKDDSAPIVPALPVKTKTVATKKEVASPTPIRQKHTKVPLADARAKSPPV